MYIYIYTCGFNEFMCVDVGSIPALLLVCYDVNTGLIDPVITLGYHHIIDKLHLYLLQDYSNYMPGPSKDPTRKW